MLRVLSIDAHDGKRTTTELYSHLIIGTVCTCEDLISTIIFFIISCLKGTYTTLHTWDFDFWETAMQQEGKYSQQKLHSRQAELHITLSNVKKQILYGLNSLTKFGEWFCI